MTINFENTWRPLPDVLTIKDSAIDGLGCYTTVGLNYGTILGLMRVMYHGQWIRTPLGGFINHSETPNCKNIEETNEYGDQQFYLVTLTDIEPGEELTLCYQMPEYHKPS